MGGGGRPSLPTEASGEYEMHWHVDAVRHDRTATQRISTFWNLDGARLQADGMTAMLQGGLRVYSFTVEECESLECIVDGLGA